MPAGMKEDSFVLERQRNDFPEKEAFEVDLKYFEFAKGDQRRKVIHYNLYSPEHKSTHICNSRLQDTGIFSRAFKHVMHYPINATHWASVVGTELRETQPQPTLRQFTT
jgi:hypothetical protein